MAFHPHGPVTTGFATVPETTVSPNPLRCDVCTGETVKRCGKHTPLYREPLLSTPLATYLCLLFQPFHRFKASHSKRSAETGAPSLTVSPLRAVSPAGFSRCGGMQPGTQSHCVAAYLIGTATAGPISTLAPVTK